jgi:hypothetical protein
MVAKLRQSGRHAMDLDGASVTDEDVMMKAMRHKAEQNLDTSGTSPSSKSFTRFSDSRIAANLGSIGVSLGRSSSDILVSTSVLKHMEYDRLTVVPKVFTSSETPFLDDEEANATMDGQLLSSLVGVVSEAVLDETELDSLYDLRASGRKSKTSAEKRSLKRPKVSKTKVVSR